jgi:hypothetical protein
MYKLIEYYEENGKVKWHLCEFSDTKEKIDRIKEDIAKQLNEVGIETLEVIATKNIDSMKEILKREDIKIFQVIGE